MKNPPPIIEPGQIWTSGDPRDGNRRIRIIGVSGDTITVATVGTARKTHLKRSAFRAWRTTRGFYLEEPK